MDKLSEYLLHLKQRIAERGVRLCPGVPLADYPTVKMPPLSGRTPIPADIGWDNNHFPINNEILIKLGLTGVVARARTPRQDLPAAQEDYRQAIAAAYEMLADYVARYAQEAQENFDRTGDPAMREIAKNCEVLSKDAPQTFAQGVQLIWLLFNLRGRYRSSLGRLDQALWPLYEKDILARNARQEAFELLTHMWIGFNLQASGDTLMNLMLGGVDEQGNDASNDLSLLMMEVACHVAQTEPHVNVRIHEKTSEAFLEQACRMISMGQGQGVLYFDNALIPSLLNSGVSLADARRYANDGCTEITFDGHSAIHFWQMEMVKTLELTLFRGQANPATPHLPVKKWSRNMQDMYFESQLTYGHDSGDPVNASSFEDFLKMFFDQLHFQIGQFLNRIDDEILSWRRSNEKHTSLMIAGLCEKTLDEGIDPLRGGFSSENWQLLSGSIPTLADALIAIKIAVYERRLCTMQELIRALTNNYRDHEPLRRQLQAMPKFGNDIAEVDELAGMVSDAFLTQVEQHRGPDGIRVFPGIYNIDYHMMASALAATPDGRHDRDMVSDHYSPTPGCAVNGPTAVLMSASGGHLERGCASSPIQLALPRGKNDIRIARRILEAARNLRLPVVSLTFQSVEELEDAMIHPENHQDLVVRVWGFNARFVELDEGLQKHIIARTLGRGL